jgi:hypothetical protein
MWVLLTRRIRMWLLLTIALPLARRVIHRLAEDAGRRDGSARRTRVLRRADSALTAVSRRPPARARR